MIALKIFSDPIDLDQLKNFLEARGIAILNTTRSNAASRLRELEKIVSSPLLHLMVEDNSGEWHNYIMTNRGEHYPIEDTSSLVVRFIKLWEEQGEPNEFFGNLRLLSFSERAEIALDRAPKEIKKKLYVAIDMLMKSDPMPDLAKPSNYDKNIMIIKVDEEIRLFYSKTSDRLNIVDIIDRSGYSND